MYEDIDCHTTLLSYQRMGNGHDLCMEYGFCLFCLFSPTFCTHWPHNLVLGKPYTQTIDDLALEERELELWKTGVVRVGHCLSFVLYASIARWFFSFERMAMGCSLAGACM